MRIQEALEGYWLSLRADNASPLTLERYGRAWRRFGAWLAERGVTEIEQLRADHARGYILARMEAVSPITAHYEMSPLKAFTAWLDREDLLDRDPFRKVRKPKVEQPEMEVLEAAEVRRLLAVFDPKNPAELRDLLIVKLILATGLRRVEAVSARVEDLDRENGSLLVLGKGRKERRVPIPADLGLALWRYVKTTRCHFQPEEAGPLFVTRTGGPVDPVVLTHRFARHVERAGIERRATLHGLRHWAATAMLAQAMPLELVSRTLGHADATITSRVYAHVAFRDIQRAHRAADPLALLK